jgi:N-formylglutamate deformylase
MTASRDQMVSQREGRTALVLDSPHSGTHYPTDFNHACDPHLLRRAEDTHVDRLFDFATVLGAHWVEAHFPRSYIDVNRDVSEVDVEMFDQPWPAALTLSATQRSKLRLGKGLLWRCLDDGTPIYDRLLSVAEARQRIQRCWQPYHLALDHAVARARQQHGYCIHLNCHSMPSIAQSHATEHPGMAHPDIVLGNRDDSTSSPQLVQLVAAHFIQRGYAVAINHPYKGVELVRRHGRPEMNQHSIQLEVNRKLYMNEQTLAPHDGFARLRADLLNLVQLLTAYDVRRTAELSPP